MNTWVNEQAERWAISDSDYVRCLRCEEMRLEQFRASQRQFYFAVRYFSRPMAALMSRVPSSVLRQGLMHNLMDEHGWDDGGSGINAALAHDRTFVRFLESLGDYIPIEQELEGPAVRAFNAGLMGVCLTEPVEMAFGCLGIIEYVFADLSAAIGDAVVRRGWVLENELVHYKLHAEIDKRHAADFFDVVASAWDSGGESKRAIQNGVHLGLHLFERLYADLWRATKAVL